jgi:hypothetical protein
MSGLFGAAALRLMLAWQRCQQRRDLDQQKRDAGL